MEELLVQGMLLAQHMLALLLTLLAERFASLSSVLKLATTVVEPDLPTTFKLTRLAFTVLLPLEIVSKIMATSVCLLIQSHG
jgi:hypothetical protein